MVSSANFRIYGLIALILISGVAYLTLTSWYTLSTETSAISSDTSTCQGDLEELLRRCHMKAGQGEFNSISVRNEHDMHFNAALCLGKPIPRVAIVISGGLRTLINPIVYLSIKQHIIDSFGGNSTVFMNFGIGQDDLLSSYVTEEAIENAMRVLQPDYIHDPRDPVPPYQFNSNCNFTEGSLMNDPEGWPQRFWYQYGNLERVWPDILKHEEKVGQKFDWIIRLRTDTVIFSSIQPHCLFDAEQNMMYNYHSDHVGLLPRSLGPALFGLLESYRQCDEALIPAFNNEDYLKYRIQQAGGVIGYMPWTVVVQRPVHTLQKEPTAFCTDHPPLSPKNCDRALYDNPTNVIVYPSDL